ncbi:MAG: cell volume regulation protein A [Clostridium sp.]|jgi:cell volume regulation protein A
MIMPLIIASVVVIICILSSKVLYKFAVPSLLIFIILGMAFGSEGIVGIPFENYLQLMQHQFFQFYVLKN